MARSEAEVADRFIAPLISLDHLANAQRPAQPWLPTGRTAPRRATWRLSPRRPTNPSPNWRGRALGGTVAELLARLNCTMSAAPFGTLPKAPNALSTALRRMASNLHAAGIEIQFSRAALHGRRIVSP